MWGTEPAAQGGSIHHAHLQLQEEQPNSYFIIKNLPL